MQDDKIKEAFKKIRDDMNYFFFEINSIKSSLESLDKTLKSLNGIPTDSLENPTLQGIIPTPTDTPTHIPTDNLPLQAVKGPISYSSTGNDGVPTNKQTNKQTNQQILQHIGNEGVQTQNPLKNEENLSHSTRKVDKIGQLARASEILASLDSLKKEVRVKFKKLTQKEMLIYSTIYQFEDQGFTVDYSLISEQLGLSETSIRDYTRKIMAKGIPLDKIKQDNKKVILSIPRDLKKIASLNTILQLREL